MTCHRVQNVIRPVVFAGLALSLVFAPAAAQTRMPEASRYGINDDHILTSPQTLQRVKDAGFGWVHYLLYWNLVNPAPGVYDWSAPDAEIQSMADLGLNVYVRIAFPPAWTIGATYPNGSMYHCYAPPGDPRDTNRDEIRDDDDTNCKNPDRRPGYRAEYSPDFGRAYPADYDRTQDFRQFVGVPSIECWTC